VRCPCTASPGSPFAQKSRHDEAKPPSLPGVYTQAETLEELEAKLREAIELYLSDDSAVDEAVATENGRVLEIAV
jgi:hypothetical protein